MNDSKEYLEKKAKFASMLTFYGRNVVIEILQDSTVDIYKVHLSSSNKEESQILKIRELAKKRNIEIKTHSKEALSRVSKNSKQDQGVAIDVYASNYKNSSQIFDDLGDNFRLLALDGINNPQNLGMIIRSAAAGNIDAIILSESKSAKLSPLVMKSSAGTVFKIPIYHTKNLAATLREFKNSEIYVLSSHANSSLKDLHVKSRSIFVLGNESDGVSKDVFNCSTSPIKIDMNRGVESLNVAITSAIISFLP